MNNRIERHKPFARNVWIGLVGVRALPGSNILEGAEGAYVNVLAWADNEVHYRREVANAVITAGLKLQEIEDPEPLVERMKKFSIESDLLVLAKTIRRKGDIHFGVFYPHEKPKGPKMPVANRRKSSART